MSSKCNCGHSVYDHKVTSARSPGECLYCFCSVFDAPKSPPPELLDIEDYTSLGSGAPVLDWVIERLERKACPQGLNVLAEELQWMGQASLTYDRLYSAVRAELRKPHSRLVVVSEGIYWLDRKNIPAGWSMFAKGMLPCFYREYPPDISWEEFESPENLLPRPRLRERTVNPSDQQTTKRARSRSV